MSYHADRTSSGLYPLSIVEEQPAAMVQGRGGLDLRTILIVVVGLALLWHLWRRSQATRPNEASRLPDVRIVARVRDRLRSGEHLTADEMRSFAERLTAFLRLAGSE